MVEPQYLFLSKDGHNYLFCYRLGQEQQLARTLLDCAQDPTTPLDWTEVLFLLEHLDLSRTPPPLRGERVEPQEP